MQVLSKRVLIVMVILNVFLINSAFALVDGKPFSDLPHPSGQGHNIQEFANATVGLQIYDKQNDVAVNCTGIRVAKNKIITAAHCFKDKYDSIDIMMYDPVNGVSSTTLSKSDVYINIPSINISFSFYDYDIDVPELVSSDVALITVGALPSAFNNENFINIRNPGQIITSVATLNNHMFNPDTRLYAFGWGSHQIFEYATKLTNTDYMSNTLDYYLEDSVTSSWSYLISSLGKYTIKNFDLNYTFNQLHDSYWFKPDLPNWEYIQFSNTKFFTNTNVLVISAFFDKNNNFIVGENGDSGGPLIACNYGDNNKCALIGIYGLTTYLFDGSVTSSDYATTANPITIELLI